MQYRQHSRTLSTLATTAGLALLPSLANAQGSCGIGINYCTSNPSSTGSAAGISAEGSSLGDAGIGSAGNSFTLRASPVPSQPGIFFHGTGQTDVPFGNGRLCANGTITRLGVQFPAGGADATETVSGDPFPSMGTSYFQYWFRDPAGGGSAFNTSNGLELLFDGSGCAHMGIDSLSTTTVGVGTLVDLIGGGFGVDEDDICAMISDGTSAAFTRAQSASGDGLGIQVRSVLPGISSGQLMVEVGDGRTGTPTTGIPGDVTFLQPAWGWMRNGGPMAIADEPVDVLGGATAAGCQYYWGGVNSAGRIEIVIPAGAVCPPNATIDVALHGATTASGSFSGDFHAVFTSTQTLTTCDCATRACAALTATFLDLFGVLISCSTTVLGNCQDNPEVRIEFTGPSFEQFTSGWADILICP